MGIFKKSNINIKEDSGKTPVKFKRREKLLKSDPKRAKARKIRRYLIVGTIAVILGAGLYFGLAAYNSLKGMFADGSGILSLLNGCGETQFLRGEKTGRVNVLLLGTGDEGYAGEGLTDTIIVASYDTASKGVALFSLPRDLYVPIENYGSAKINAAHAYGEQNNYPGGGPALAGKTVENVVGVPMNYYVRVDFSGFKDIVDSLGGVTVDVENSFCDYQYQDHALKKGEAVCFDKGKQKLDGIRALQYSRSRHAAGVEGSDFARSKRQQKLLVAIKEKALSGDTLTNPKKMLDLFAALGKHIKTDAPMADMLRVFELAKGIDNSKIISRNFDNSAKGLLISSSSATTGYILQPRSGDFKEIQDVVKNIFSIMGIKDENANIGLYNGTWNYGYAATIASEMKDEGYTVSKTGDNKNKLQTTTIVDYTGGKKPKTIKALEDKFGVKASTEESGTQAVDIKVIVGADYTY